MKKSKVTRSLLAACSIVALTAVMYGCTHSGDDGVPQTEHDQTVSDKEAAEAEAKELRDEINALRVQLGLEEDDNLGDSVEELQEQVRSLRKEIDDAAEEKRMADEKAAREAMEATAKVLFTGMGADTDFDIGTVTLAATGLTAADINSGNTSLKAGDDGASMGEWSSKGYGFAPETSGSAASQEALVYTSDEGTTPVPFVEQYATELGASDNLADAQLTAALVASAHFATDAGSKEHEIPEDHDSVEIAGTFHGAPGIYRCSATGTGNTCESSVAATGISLGGDGTQTWTFTPNAGADVQVADDDYLFFGWWLQTGTDGALSVDTFTGIVAPDSGAEDTVAAADLDSLNGEAEYTGPAIGKYALYEPITGPKEGGHFTATATLNADFTNSMISGEITGFMTDTGAKDWKVSLSKDAVSATGVVADSSTTDDEANSTIWSIGDAAAASEGWSAQLYANGEDDGVPQTGTGEFRATYGEVGHMFGAFGVSRDE